MSSDSVLKIVKDKDDFPNVIEIKENAKGDPLVSVKVRRMDLESATKDAVLAYNKVKEDLSS